MHSLGSTGETGCTVIVPVLVPPFELTVICPVYVVQGVNPVVSTVTVTVSVSVVVVPLVGLTVIHGWSALTVHVNVPLPQFLMSKFHDFV